MKFEFEKEFRADHPETIGETDKEYDQYNYTLWLEQQLKNCNLQNVSNRRELLLAYSEWWDKKYSPQRKDFHRQKDVDAFLS